MKRLIFASIAACAVMLAVVCLSSTAHAATFTVTTAGDESAIDPSVSCAINGGSDCTLRSSIEAANAQVGSDSVEFNISGSGVHTIALGSALPNITDPVTIDGTTQSGAQCGTLVPATLPGTNTSHTLLIEVSGGGGVFNLFNLSLGSDGTEIKGLVLNNANANGVVTTNDNIGSFTIDCNYIGTNSSGTAAANLTYIGIRDDSGSNTFTIQNNLLSGTGTAISLGSSDTVNINDNLFGTAANGTSALANNGTAINLFGSTSVTINHNVISGNNGSGVSLTNGQNVTFTGNVVGLGIDGNALGNSVNGLDFFAMSNFTIGGVTNTLRNIISANGGDGIHIYNNCSYAESINSTTYGNYIGTQMDGSVKAGFGNGAAGIEVNEYQGSCGSVYKHIIGGDEAGQANIIAGNTNQGILIHQDSSHNVFSVTTIGNSIYGNGQFGIDLAADSGGDGMADTDLGPNVINNFLMSYPTTNANYYINRPVINSASYTGNQLTVNYSYQANGIQDNYPSIMSTDLVGYRLDFYLNSGTQDGAYSGYSQGKTHLGSFIINGSETNATHIFTSPIALSGNQNISVTATVLWTTDPSAPRSGNGPPYTSPK